MARVDLRGARQRIARMQVERHVELFAFGPEAVVARIVEVDHGIDRLHLREPVHQRAAESELLHAAHELARCAVGILQGERRQPLEAVGALRHSRARKSFARLAVAAALAGSGMP